MQRDDPPGYFGPLAEDLRRLREIGLTGKLSIFGGGQYGKGNKDSRAIIVMQRQLNKRTVDLPQPDRVTVIYVQDENNNWRMYPSNAPTLNRNIRLEVPAHKPNITDYWVELAGGARKGAQAFFWD